SKTGHIAMMVHFLAVGLVFFWPIMGVDRVQEAAKPRRTGGASTSCGDDTAGGGKRRNPCSTCGFF
ncbi:cytochrome c oxidase assembly protein, partial [Streptomyces minutiscleroticus]|uniref:cytochrome c oxidase assembly protein n=1 Tax=Streptomyces minutiscleroticus TaxID=68238 RepID=UPI0033171A9B